MCSSSLLSSCDKLYKNEGYLFDGMNRDQAYEDEKQIALAFVLLHQRLKIPSLDFNVPASFNIDNFKFKSCFIPQ